MACWQMTLILEKRSIRIKRDYPTRFTGANKKRSHSFPLIVLTYINFALFLYRKTEKETMNQIIITPKSEQEHSFVMEMLKRMKIKATSIEEQPLHRMTIEEYRAMAERSIADAEAGRTISQSEMEERVASWR